MWLSQYEKILYFLSCRNIHQPAQTRPIHKGNCYAIRTAMKIKETSRVLSVPQGTLGDRLHFRVPEMYQTQFSPRKKKLPSKTGGQPQ